MSGGYLMALAFVFGLLQRSSCPPFLKSCLRPPLVKKATSSLKEDRQRRHFNVRCFLALEATPCRLLWIKLLHELKECWISSVLLTCTLHGQIQPLPRNSSGSAKVLAFSCALTDKWVIGINSGEMPNDTKRNRTVGATRDIRERRQATP
ncbi:hypothetical protein BaRGS_00013766, partial [Batillaria attramentaria]